MRRHVTNAIVRRALRWFVSVVIVCHSAAVESSPRISTVAGTGSPGYSGDNGPAALAQLANPFGVVRGLDGALYICEVDNHIIRCVARDGVISTVAGTGQRGDGPEGDPLPTECSSMPTAAS
jgi:hypothetical protein